MMKTFTMKTFIKSLSIILFLLLGLNSLFAQCEPDPDCTEMLCPTEFEPAVEDEYYEQVLTINLPEEIQGINIHHIDLLSIGNIPPGMIYECQDMDCTFWPLVPKCVQISGTPEIDSWGDYRLYLTFEVFMDLYGNPVSLGEQQDSSAVVTIESQLHANFNIDYGMTGVVCNNSETEITYIGDATDAATYHWDFGDHITVVSGDGAGPYVIEYTQGYTGMDSISLFVQEAPYTSPVFTESFMVDICTSVAEMENEVSYSVFPNPMNDVLNITSKENATAFIYDLSGKEIIKTNIYQGTSSVDVSELQRGIYFLSITNLNTISTQKIIKK